MKVCLFLHFLCLPHSSLMGKKNREANKIQSSSTQMSWLQALSCTIFTQECVIHPLSLCLLSLNETQRSPKASGENCWISLMAESKSPNLAWICLQTLIHQTLKLDASNKAGWPWEVWTESQTLQVLAYFKPFPSWALCLLTKWKC